MTSTPAALRTVRIAVVGDSPCHLCHAACCKQNGHAYAVLLEGDEVRRFAAWSASAMIQTSDAGLVSERVIPYRDGRCPFLGGDDLCTIYEDRPNACRRFQCVRHFNEDGVGSHGRFLDLNPRVLRILEQL